jgi:hypothetical protein
MNNCKEYFGHQCEFFSRRLYEILARSVPLKRIYFNEYIQRFYNIFLKEGNNNKERSSFIFQMIDYDGDGVLNAIDLLNAFEIISMSSKFGKEIHALMVWYTSKNVSESKGTASKKKEVHDITLDQYYKLLPSLPATRKGAPSSNVTVENTKYLSIVCDDLKRKIMSEPKQFASEGAVFVLDYDSVSADYTEEKLKIEIINKFA